jgi:diphthine synthase
MVFYLIGLGLGDERDISVKGLEIVKRCNSVYLESYTSILGVDKKRLEEFYGRAVIEADRETCETTIDTILEELATTEEGRK